jgi:hypothetical protein
MNAVVGVNILTVSAIQDFMLAWERATGEKPQLLDATA